VYISQYAVLPETGPTGAAGVSATAFSSLEAVLVSLEQALRNSNPHAAKLGKTNLLIVYDLPLQILRYNQSRFYVNRLADARKAVKFAKLRSMRLAFGVLALVGATLISGQDPFAKPARARVLLFVRTDCPITNRYAPEIARIAREFTGRGVDFWLVYPDSAETAQAIERHKAEYHLPGTAVRDQQHVLVKRAEATISPQAAVFDHTGRLVYSGRIDDRYVAFGKARPEPRTHDLEAAIAATLEGRSVAEARTHSVGCYLTDVK
jgi:hypothetical protein